MNSTTRRPQDLKENTSPVPSPNNKKQKKGIGMISNGYSTPKNSPIPQRTLDFKDSPRTLSRSANVPSNSPIRMKLFGSKHNTMKSELLTTLAQPAPTVFGMALKTIFSLQQQLMDITIPLVVHKCIEYLLLPGFVLEEGLFRKSGTSTTIEQLKSDMSPFRTSDETFFHSKTDPHDVTGILKAFFRDLPSPLIKSELHDALLSVVEETAQDSTKCENIRNLLETELGVNEYNTLVSLIYLLDTVQQHQDVNLMSSHNLALVWAPNLVVDSSLSLDMQMKFNTSAVHYLSFIISNFATIFPKFQSNFNIEKQNTTKNLLTVPCDQDESLSHNSSGLEGLANRFEMNDRNLSSSFKSTESEKSTSELENLTREEDNFNTLPRNPSSISDVTNTYSTQALPQLNGEFNLPIIKSPARKPIPKIPVQFFTDPNKIVNEVNDIEIVPIDDEQQQEQQTLSPKMPPKPLPKCNTPQKKNNIELLFIPVEEQEMKEEVKEEMKEDNSVNISIDNDECSFENKFNNNNNNNNNNNQNTTPRRSPRLIGSTGLIGSQSISKGSLSKRTNVSALSVKKGIGSIGRTFSKKVGTLSGKEEVVYDTKFLLSNEYEMNDNPNNSLRSKKRGRPSSTLITDNSSILANGSPPKKQKTIIDEEGNEMIVNCSTDSTYYYNDNCKENSKVINLLLSNRTLPSVLRDDATNPMSLDEGLTLVRSMNTLIVHSKDNEELKYYGPISSLSDLQIKKLIVNDKTYNMRTPSMILNESSILIIGWSKHSWTSHAVLKCEPNPELFTSEKI